MKALGDAPWTMELARVSVSVSDDHPGHAGYEMAMAMHDDAAVAGIERIATAIRRHCLAGAYRLFLPSGPTGVYIAYTYPDRRRGNARCISIAGPAR